MGRKSRKRQMKSLLNSIASMPYPMPRRIPEPMPLDLATSLGEYGWSALAEDLVHISDTSHEIIGWLMEDGVAKAWFSCPAPTVLTEGGPLAKTTLYLDWLDEDFGQEERLMLASKNWISNGVSPIIIDLVSSAMLKAVKKGGNYDPDHIMRSFVICLASKAAIQLVGPMDGPSLPGPEMAEEDAAKDVIDNIVDEAMEETLGAHIQDAIDAHIQASIEDMLKTGATSGVYLHRLPR